MIRHLPFFDLGAKSQPNSLDGHCFGTLCLQHTLDRLSLICQNLGLLEWCFIISIDTCWDWFQRTYVLITTRKNYNRIG